MVGRWRLLPGDGSRKRLKPKNLQRRPTVSFEPTKPRTDLSINLVENLTMPTTLWTRPSHKGPNGPLVSGKRPNYGTRWVNFV